MDAIHKLLHENKDELEADGSIFTKQRDIIERLNFHIERIEKSRGKTITKLKDGVQILSRREVADKINTFNMKEIKTKAVRGAVILEYDNNELRKVTGQNELVTFGVVKGVNKNILTRVVLMLKITEESLITDAGVREQFLERVDVLDRVGRLLLLPALNMATTQHVADFYGVDKTVIYQISNRHKDELIKDGYCKMTGRDLRKFSGFDTMSNAKIIDKVNHIVIEHDGVESKLSNSVNTFFPKRAILRIGMMLRDSEVAKEVRNQLDVGYIRIF